MTLTRKAWPRMIAALGLFLVLGATSARADIYVTTSHFSESRVTPSADGVIGVQTWGDTSGGFRITWDIAYNTTTQLYTYQYWLTNADYTTLDKGLSHFILQLSAGFTQADLTVTSGSIEDLRTFTASDPGGSNPNLPGDIYGVKFASNTVGTIQGKTGVDYFSFTTKHAPVWGNFYAVDGKNTDPPTSAWNTGYLTPPTSTTTDFTNWIARPDTIQGPPGPGPTPTPEPSTLAIAGLGALGFLGYGLRRRRSK